MKLTRREFAKLTGAGIGAALVAGGCGVSGGKGGSLDELYAGFQNPPSSARPFFRWWWNGNRVTREEITRELELMAKAGAGGVEINPIALHQVYGDPPQRALDWLSEQWNQMVLHAVNECHRLGMQADLIVGTGWPFGGRFLNDEETIQGLESRSEAINGPGEKKVKVFDRKPERELIQVALVPNPLNDVGDVVDMTDRVDDQGHVTFDPGSGRFDLVTIVRRFKFREVVHGAPGADGPVLDHFNKSAVQKYLNRMSDKLNPVLGGALGNKLRSMFCDSIELNGANWTSDVPAEFQKRRGYDLMPWLPLLMKGEVAGDVQEKLRRVRYDFSLTLAELFMERFIHTFHQWCRDNKTKSRYQAYGHPWLYTDLLDGYLVPDIPESDQWLFNRGWVRQAELDELRYATWNKYAAAGGRLTGKKIVSCEAVTNTSGVFEASPAYLKQATDINIVTGVNHLVLHGFNYSPPEVPFPGWIRYGTYFNENNPWWPHVRLWMDYTARLSHVFQNSQPIAEVAVMGPTADVWSNHGLDRLPWITTPKYLHALWQSFNHHGCFADYVNPTILEGARFSNGEMIYGPMRFRLLVLAHVETVRPETASALLKFARAGGRIVFLETVPDKAPGLIGHETGDGTVQQTMKQLLSEYPEQVRLIEGPVGDYPIALAGQLIKQTGIEPAVGIDNPDEKLFFIRNKRGEADIYFFSNMDRKKKISFNASFPTKNKTLWQWDPESGERKPFGMQGSNNKTKISLEPLQSLLLVFEEESGQPEELREINNRVNIQLIGPWQVELRPVEGAPFIKEFATLVDFSSSQELRNFAGTATFRHEFQLPSGNQDDLVLVIGEVNGCAEVKLNGQTCGVQWWGKKKFDVTQHVRREGQKNLLEITVSTVLLNYCASIPNEVAKLWTTRRGRDRRVSAGLPGPVNLFNVG